MKFKATVLIVIINLSALAVFGQPYFKTHVKNKFVNQNSYIGMTVDTTTPPVFNSIKSELPQPYWNARPDVLKCYWRTWEIAFSNLKSVNPKSGFVSPFIDPAFNGHIFMWDCSFMTMYGKYAMPVFNIQNTLNNFYSKQHIDGFICREIRESDGTDCFERFDPSSTGPNIMPWSEWEYFLNFNDTARLSKVFPALLAYYQWFQTYRSWPDGTYYSSGWGCGMDNQPRMAKNFNQQWSHGFMSWIDISLQQVYAGNILIEMADKLGRKADVVSIEKEILSLNAFINSKMWDTKESYYFDRRQDGTLNNVKSIAAYWALLSGTLPENRVQEFVSHLEDTTMFARVHRVPTLSADNPNFNPNGGYWNGAIWAPTNYMVLRGLTKYGFDSLAYEIASNHLNNVVEVFNKTNDIRENYAPDKVQGNDGNNFVGWTGLVPISDLFEYVFGIRPNVPENTLLIDVRLTDEYGIKQYPFGKKGMLDIMCKKRKKETDKPSITIKTNVPLKIILKWKKGELVKNIQAGNT
ncbi:MAG: trehalase family glycosidase, partial [Salinivirgaceae bacterium]|nr:trehalase family glycosidase [Salinivirgaceae bacterium]